MRVATSLLLLAALAALAAPARADSRPADESFARGRALMKQHDYAGACAAFEDSYRLDPALGTLFNLADCEVSLGKLASAWNHYRELARTDTNAERKQMSAKLAADLAPRVPKLVVTIDGAHAHATLTVDGHDSSDLVGVDIPIDLGKHAVVVAADGFAPWRDDVAIDREGTTTHVVAHLAPPSATPATAVWITDRPPPPRSSGRRTTGLALAIAGGAILAGGLVTGGLAYSEFQDARTCTGCDRGAKSDSAGRLGDVSTVLVAAGAIAAVAGVYLWRSSSPSKTTATALVTPSAAAVAITTHF